MSIRGRIRTGLIRTKGRLYYNYIIKRAQNPCSLNMSLYESEKILRELEVQNEKIVFHGEGDAYKSKNLFDLSIVVPVYNGEKYLKECIDSILKQVTNYSFEVICVDDGSTDSSIQILRTYEDDSRIKVVREENKGISGARNYGLKMARGKYVMFIDNDDMFLPNTFQYLMKYAEKYNADIVKCAHKIVGKRQYDVFDSKFYVKRGRMEKELIVYNGYVWGMLIKREIFKKINFPEGFWYEDMITRLLIYRMCKSFVYIDSPLYFHRMHKNNASAKVWSPRSIKALDQFRLAKKITEYAFLLKLPLDEWVYRVYLSEFGKLLYERTINLDLRIRQAIFVQCCNMLRLLISKIKITHLGKYENILNNALINSDFDLWELVCKYYL